MSAHTGSTLALALVATTAWGDVFTVTRKADAGSNSLRWAIKRANHNTRKDTIEFAPKMAGKTIILASTLPDIKEETIIDGDIDDDGAPDVMLNGVGLAGGSGLVVKADGSSVIGLAIGNFSEHGIHLKDVTWCIVHSCHLGLNLAGLASRPNAVSDLRIDGGHHHQIGGSSMSERNVIGGAAAGVYVEGSTDNVIAGSYFGINRQGTAALSSGAIGIVLIEAPGLPCERNVIGGNQAGERNVFAGLAYGVRVWRADESTISGNTFGLAADGAKELSMGTCGVLVTSPSTSNTIGGTSLGQRNVFAGGEGGVLFGEPLTVNNRVRGNYFGTNLGGTKQRTLTWGVKMEFGAKAQTIGGSPATANVFALKSPNKMYGVWLDEAGDQSLIDHNRFGYLPDGTPTGNYDTAVYADTVGCEVRDNTINNASVGVLCIQTPKSMQVMGNDLKRCGTAVDVGPAARCLLGNLGNVKTSDDGGNQFRSSNDWFIRNSSANLIRAEGNSFGTTVKSEINAKIRDYRDDNALGVVDFDPLAGGINPSGGILAISGACAVGGRGSAIEVAFSLSAPAHVTVTVLNLAGRTVATVTRRQVCQAGLQRIIWTGRSDGGTTAPSGRYLLRVEASDGSGRRTQALVPALAGP